MSNDFYNHNSGVPGELNRGASASIRAEFDLVGAAFDKLPSLTGVFGSTGNYAVAAGSLNAWTVAVASTVLVAYTDGMQVRVKFPAANTITTPTLNLNSLGAKTIVAEDGTALGVGNIAANMIAALTYNASSGKLHMTDTALASSAAAAASASAASASASAASTSAGAASASATTSENWAAQIGADVTGAPANSRSSKSWAQEDLHGATLGGSSKDWAQSASLPDGTSKSAKSYASDSSASATAAAASRTAIDQRIYPGTYAIAPTTKPPEGAGAAIQNGDEYFGTDGFTYVRVAGAWVNQTAAAAASATAAASSASAASGSAAAASSSQGAAAVSATSAANYAAAAATGAKFYNTIALGNAGVADAATFGVIAGGADGLTRPSIYRRESAGVSTLLYTVLPAAEFDAEFMLISEPGVAFAVIDANRNAALLVNTDGSISASEVTVTKLNGVAAASLQAVAALSNTTEIAAYSVADANGKVALEVKSDGTVHVSALVVDTNINGFSASNLGGGGTTPYAGTFAAELIYFNNDGQSLGEGSFGNVAITTAKEFDNIGFAAASSSPVAYVDLTVANTQASNPPGTGRGESPMYGALGSIKERIAAEVGLAYTDQKYQLLACNNAIGGAPITNLNKGTASYTAVLSQVSAAYSIAQTEGRTFKAGATFWTQGENYTTGYQAALQQLADDFDADMRAITGQTEPVLLICYQTPTSIPNPALDQLAAHDANSKIFVASPAYFLNFGDGQHIDATSSQILGGYYGICFKRVAIDGQAFEPLRPISHTKQGKILNVKFHVPKLPLVLDGVLNAMQPNYGFTMVDGSGNPITINSVALIEPDTVKIVTNVTIPVGAVLKYALNVATGKGPFSGGCGNLRDSQGNTIVFRTYPMHNWCVMFQRAL